MSHVDDQPSAPEFFRSFASVALGNYASIVLSVALSALVARRLGAVGLGQLALMLTAVQVLTALVSSWTLTGLVRFGAQELAASGSISQTFWARAVLVTPGFLIVVLGAALFGPQVARYFGISQLGVWLVVAYFAVSQLLLTAGSIFQAAQQMSRYGTTLFLDKALAFVAILSLPARLATVPIWIISTYTASSLLVLGLAIAWLKPGTLSPVVPGRRALEELWKFSVPALIASGVSLGSGPAIVYAIINHFHPLADLGVYSLANQIAGVLQQLAIIVAMLLLPRLSVMVARGQTDQLRMLVQRVLPYGLLGVALLLAASALAAKAGIVVVFGRAFAGAAEPLMVLVAGAMALSIFYLFVPFFQAHGQAWTLTAISSASAAVNLIAAVALVPAYGGMGAALASLLAALTAAGLALVAAGRSFQVSVLPLAAMALPTLVVVVCGVLLEGGRLYLAGIAAMVLSTYALIVGRGLFRADDRAALDRVGVPASLSLSVLRVFSPFSR